MLAPNESCHRVGGGAPANLKLRPAKEKLNPPGISILIGGTPAQAASDMRRVFGPNSTLGKKASIVGTVEIAKIQDAGFDVIEDSSSHFPNHGRLIHSIEGVAGFSDENLKRLAQVFTNHTGL